MAISNPSIQVLREIDKLDKIGLDGVCAMLGDGLRDASGAFNRGVGLSPIQVGMIRLFFTEAAHRPGDTNTVVIDRIRAVSGRLSQIRSRIGMMAVLEETRHADGRTAWDMLLALPATTDETWSTSPSLMRPGNIAWALDDLVAAAV